MSIASEQVAGVYRRQVGGILVTALNDGVVSLPLEYFSNTTPDDAQVLLRASGRRPPFASAINTFLLQMAGKTVLVDTGAGGNMGPGAGKLPSNLRAAGIAAEDIDAVVLTHCHVDHIGGLLDAAGAPAFPRAELYVAAAELAFWEDDAAKAAAPEARRGSFDGARRATAPYASRTHRFDSGEIMPGLVAVPMPGHSPGHTGYQVTDGDETLLIVADLFHIPDLQAPRPDIGIAFDSDPAQAIATRRSVLARVAAEDLLITGMHMSFPGFARIAMSGDGYAVQPEVWRPL